MKKVIVGMSGGVDSSVAAYLLLQQGYDVIGVTMQIWQDEDHSILEESGGCCGLSAVDDARRVCDKLGIPHYVMNFKRDFKVSVIDYFVAEYQEGRTPNPCIACNRHVKWESMLRRCMEIGADYIATGHYARITQNAANGRYALRYAISEAKDQTYALYNLTQEQLSHTLMPVGEYTKDEIRRIAADIGLLVAHKPDSQEICFIPDNDYGRFIENQTGQRDSDKTGNFVDTNGHILGRHKGITHYTIGQRKGLGIAFGKPMFVQKIDTGRNEVVLCDNDALFTCMLTAGDINFMAWERFDGNKRASGKIRYSHRAADCTLKLVLEDGEERIQCTFDQPQRAITPGQAAVFYDGDVIVCGGTII